MLALYGAVALAEQSARTVVDRSHDIALARLRGLHGSRLVTFAAAPLLTVSLVGIGVGSAAGTWFAGRIADDWGVPYTLGTREVVVAVGILAGAWVTIAVVAAAVIHRPLVEVLSVQRRRHPNHWVTTFLELLLVAAACLAVYEAHRSESSWVPTIAPALVALAVGQLVMWVLALTPRLGRRLGLSLTSRRLRRDPDPGSMVRVLVAAAVLLAVTLTGARAAADWRDDAGRLQAGGPVVVPFSAGALRAYAAARDADPQGRWLMAAVAVDDLTPADRRVFVDSQRWDAVVGDFVNDTSVAGATGHMAALAGQDRPLLLRSGSLTAHVARIARGSVSTLTVELLSDEGFLRTARIRIAHAGLVTGPLRACRVGCAVVSVKLSGAAFDLDSLEAGHARILGPTTYAGGSPRVALAVAKDARAQLALMTSDVRTQSSLQGVDGRSSPVRRIGTLDAVPFVGRSGSLLDLGRVLVGAVGTVATARPVVVARADTPVDVMHRLAADGGGKPTTYTTVADKLDHTPQARADVLALLVAVGVGLVALTHLLAWLVGQAGRRSAEVAGLRTAGIRPRTVRRAYVVEALILASVVLVTAAVASVATTIPLLKPMQLVGGWTQAPILHPEIRPMTLAVVVVSVAAATALLCVVVFARFGRAARPSALRSADR
jgi:hypothetical protein